MFHVEPKGKMGVQLNTTNGGHVRDGYDKMPRKVWVGQHEFKVVVVPRADAALAPDNPETEGQADGACEFEPTVISIADDMNQSRLLETVMHELTHAVNHAALIEDGASEESIADLHGKIWTQVWIVNPRFAAWWTRTCIAVRKERASA